MKKILITLLLLIACIGMAKSQNRIVISIDGRTMSATLAENAATRALVEKLTAGPVTLSMDNYGGFEKVGALPWSLPAADTRITTKPGDIMLYTGNNIVIFYGANTWAYTPLGVLETTDPSAISGFVGNGTRQVTLRLEGADSVSDITVDVPAWQNVYALDGRLVKERPLRPGFYIVDNQKVFIK